MKNMRQRPRVEINHMVSFTCHDGKDEYYPSCDGMLINLSTNGALIESQKPLGGKFLVLGNNSTTNPRLVKGEVVYTETVISEEGCVFGMYRSGINFTDLHENSKEFVVSIVVPDTSASTTTKNTNPPPKNNLSHDFDVETINQILEDDTPTEDLLRIEGLLEDLEPDPPEYDVLENIAEVLEESSEVDSEISEIIIQPHRLNKENQQISLEKSQKTRFLVYFNTACFFTFCLIIMAATLFYTDKKIEFPLINESKPTFTIDIRELNTNRPKPIFLISNSIKSRFVKNNKSGFNFVVNGLINTRPDIAPESIKITGRIFGQNDRLLGKVNALPKNRNNSNALPFFVAFSNPPDDISRFSIDIEI